MATTIPKKRFLRVTNASALDMQSEAMRMRKVVDEQRKIDKQLKQEAARMILRSTKPRTD